MRSILDGVRVRDTVVDAGTVGEPPRTVEGTVGPTIGAELVVSCRAGVIGAITSTAVVVVVAIVAVLIVLVDVVDVVVGNVVLVVGGDVVGHGDGSSQEQKPSMARFFKGSIICLPSVDVNVHTHGAVLQGQF